MIQHPGEAGRERPRRPSRRVLRWPRSLPAGLPAATLRRAGRYRRLPAAPRTTFRATSPPRPRVVSRPRAWCGAAC